jgi:antitoxin HicB
MNKDLKQKVLEYTVIFEPAEEGGYVVMVPALPGCLTQGDTFEEAEKNIKDAIEGYLEVLKEEGEEIPRELPQTLITKITVKNSNYISA